MICAGLSKPFSAVNVVRVVDFNSGDTLEVELKGYGRKEFYRERFSREIAEHPYPVELDIDDEHNLAVLKVSTFAPNGSKKYKKRISESFQQVIEGNYGNLVIDLRNNGGGSSAMVEYLYSFIDTTGYNTPSNVIGRNSELASSRSRFMYSALGDLITFLFFARNEDVQSFRHFSQLPLGAVDTVYFKNPAKQAADAVYNGNCYVLMNGLTASAAVDFTSAFKKRNRGVLVGRQCLGPITGTWGNPAAFTLPKTGLRVSISTIRYNYDNTFRYERAGILPDFFVERSPQDVHADRDSPVDFVINLIKKR
jgi:C-terminal processing protease CtpA/Prc